MAATFPITLDSFAPRTEDTFARILVPFDFSAGSRMALESALQLRRSFGSEIHLFHLATPGEDEQFLAGIGGAGVHAGDLVLATESRLLRFVENLFPENSGEVAVHARLGTDLVQGIERAAKDARATLVLLAARQRQSMFRTQLEKVVRALNCTVMILRAPGADAPS